MTTERPNECVICLRPATGYHYGIVSCKGCKTFFRRTCVSKEETECNLRKKCFDSTEKTPINLRCIACRFRKCIEKGMKISALELKNDEKLVVNSKRLGKPEVCSTSKRLDIVRIESKETLSNNIIQSLVYLESKLEMFRLSAFNPDYLELGSLTDIMNLESKISLAEKLGPMPGWPLSKKQTSPTEITTISQMRDIPDTRPTFIVNEKVWMIFNTITTIEYIKTFGFFHQLKNRDKILLIGHVTLICLYFNIAYFSLSKKFDGCLHPDGSISPERDEVHYSLSTMSHAALIRTNIQYKEYVLLKAMCVCNPTIQDLSDHAQIILTQERQKYADILFEHCMKTQNNGPCRFVELLGIFPILEQQQQAAKNFFIFRVAPILAKYDKVAEFFHEIMLSE
ncbi:hypothetical protein CAEBREN_04591 [Caenorhabditis brenneri]|uniref:Nuclear Hormone Receptor family n=1 Tax=Caenorhabditis brenneri TaxID=135651 RepID=G0PLJ4_CAEBE|nr:hypothetical protein CAEBREN_04591 [Caenorhabditis brenneri]